MNTHHTPGPWSVITETDAVSRVSTTDRPMRHIADVVPVTWDYEKAVDSKNANARLIAAAPELLEIVRQIAESKDYSELHMDEIGQQARAAIAKATQP